jgi:DNA-binding CsgD family transcriptional regulator
MPAARPGACSVHVTPREIEVLNLLVQVFANKEIAVTLGVTTRTIKHHINSASAKLLDGHSDKINSHVLLARYWSCELFRIGAAGMIVPGHLESARRTRHRSRSDGLKPSVSLSAYLCRLWGYRAGGARS